MALQTMAAVKIKLDWGDAAPMGLHSCCQAKMGIVSGGVVISPDVRQKRCKRHAMHVLHSASGTLCKSIQVGV